MSKPTETAIRKKGFNKTKYLVFASIVSGGLGVLFFVLGTKIYHVLEAGYTLFTMVAFVLGIVAIIKIMSSGEILKVSGVVKLVTLLSVGIGLLSCFGLLMHFEIVEARTYRRSNLLLSKFHKVIVEYSKEHEGTLPIADRWCDQLVKYDGNISKYDFIILSPEDVCNFGFNSSLSGLNLSEISGNTVLLFETVGNWNLNGGPELLKKRKLDIHVLLINGSICRYRFVDGEIRRYDPDLKKMSTEPLRWDM